MASSASYEYRPFTAEETALMRKYYADSQHDFIHVGPKGYVLTEYFMQHADGIKNFPLRPSDTFVVTTSRSGTTWTQELVWLVANDLNFEKAKSIPLTDRFPFLDFYQFFMPMTKDMMADHGDDAEKRKHVESLMKTAAEVLADTPSPRFIKSHLPLSLLPTGTLDTAKVVYVARDPRDVAVSCYHFFKAIKIFGLTCDFKEYFYQVFTKNLEKYSPFFEHVKEAWAQRNHPNLLFLFYEELSKDLKGCAKRVSDFLGKQYTDEQLDQLCDHLEFDNFQKNKSVDLDGLRQLGILEAGKQNFVRKGKAGGWRESFDEEMKQHAERWIADNLRDTDLRFHS